MKRKLWKYLACVLVLTLCASLLPHIEAQAKPSLKEQIEQKEQEKKKKEEEKAKAEQEKGEIQSEIDSLVVKKGNMKQQLNSLNEELAEATEYLEDIQQQIEDKNREIELAKEELAAAIAEEERQYEAMKKRVQSMYEQPSGTYLELLVNADSLADFLNITDYIMMISSYDKKMFEKDKELKEEVIKKEEALEAEAEDLEDLKTLALLEQERINDLIQTTSEYMAAYTSQIGSAQAELSEIEKDIERKEQEIAEQEKDLAALKKKYEEELALSRQAANATKRDISEIVFAEGDRYLLANLIYCEAGGESYDGQLAVGAVVINRVLSSCYPDTVYGVIYQKSQFSPVASGRLALALSQNKATASCYSAADEAMAGTTNVGSCYYFRTPKEGLVGIQIGGHIFY